MPATASPQQWDTQFLQDLKVPQSAYTNDLNFLQHWQTRETGGGMPDKALYNLLATTQREPGSYSINSVGVQAFPSLQVGAQANASVLAGGGYPDLLSAFMSGNLDPNATYSGLSKWSGGGYSSLTGTGTGNPLTQVAGLNQQANQPAIDQLNQQNYLSAAQMAAQQALSTSDINYAQQEYQLQSALLGLSNDQLALQRGALGRQMALDPKMYMLQQAGLQDQAKLLHEQGWDNIRSGVSQEAASGNLFTKGGQAQRQLTTDQFLSQERALSYTKEQERLQYQEQLKSLSDQFKNLDITAKRYGISAKELSDRLQNQLQNISTSFQMNDLQLLGGMLSNNAQIAGLQTYVPPVTPYPYQNSGIPGPQPGNPYYGAPQG